MIYRQTLSIVTILFTLSFSLLILDYYLLFHYQGELTKAAAFIRPLCFRYIS